MGFGLSPAHLSLHDIPILGIDNVRRATVQGLGLGQYAAMRREFWRIYRPIGRSIVLLLQEFDFAKWGI